MEVKAFIPPGYEEVAEQFNAAYQFLKLFDFRENFMGPLVAKNERICRFCGRKNGETTFKKKAHVLSAFLGNRDIVSDFECDQCNHFFGIIYEDALAAFMGISRTLTSVKGQNSYPSFTSADKRLKVRREIMDDVPATVFSSENIDNETFKMDAEKGVLSVNYRENGYVPIYLYKALIKFAMSIFIGERIEESYPKTIDLLMNRVAFGDGSCFLSGYLLPFHFAYPPQVLFFQKRDPAAKMPTHVMVLYAQNFIFSLPIPLNNHDIEQLHLYDGQQSMTVPLYPPAMFYEKEAAHVQVQAFAEDFSSAEPRKNKLGSVIVQMNPADLKNVGIYDPKTGKHSQGSFVDQEIVKVVMQTRDQPIDPALFSQLLSK